jgi:hypothetical protein
MNLAIERYVWRVNRRLRRHVPPERRRAIRRELRGHLRDAAADVGPSKAVQQAGDPAEVARDYAEGETGQPRRWRPLAGAIAATAALLVVAVLQQREFRLERAAGWGDFDPWSVDLLLLRVNGDLERSLVFHVDVDRVAYVVIPLIAFLLWSRVWRRFPPTWKRMISNA